MSPGWASAWVNISAIPNGVKAGVSLPLSVLDVLSERLSLSESGVLSLPDAESLSDMLSLSGTELLSGVLSLSDAEVLSGIFSLSGVLSLFGSELLSAAPWFSSGGSVLVGTSFPCAGMLSGTELSGVLSLTAAGVLSDTTLASAARAGDAIDIAITTASSQDVSLSLLFLFIQISS